MQKKIYENKSQALEVDTGKTTTEGSHFESYPFNNCNYVGSKLK